MRGNTTRRNFLAAGLLAPVAARAAARRQPSANVSFQLPAQASSPVSYHELGSTGLKISRVSFGCMITSDPLVIERAAELGINYFDTARGYQGGNNERMVGAALKSRRKEVYIGTKSHGDTRQALWEDLETSLRELGTDYVDV